MTRRRFYAPRSAFDFDRSIVTLAPDETRHLRNVLRLRSGDHAFVFDGVGLEYECRIASCEGANAILDINSPVEPAARESRLDLTLSVGLLKGEKFDLVVQKATELGVTRIVPMLTHLGDVRLHDATDTSRRTMRWQRIALEAAKQSGRARLPVIEQPREFTSVVTSDSDNDESWRVMFAEKGGCSFLTSLKEFETRVTPVKLVSALVGTEGGWSNEEMAQARATGWTVVTLGGTAPRILRAETAAIVVTALLQRQFGDLS